MTERRAAIAAELEKGIAETVSFFKSLSPEELRAQVYQDGAQWTVQQVLAHFITIERSMQWLFKDILSGGHGTPADFDVNRFNLTQTRKYDGLALDELIERFRAVRQETIRIAREMKEEDLDREGMHAFHGKGKLDRFIRWAYEHVRIHEDDIRRHKLKKARYAHSGNDAKCWHPLAEHLQSVARLARDFAGKSYWAEEAHLSGLIHDIGKYADRFQARLLGQDKGLDHWSQRAWLALTNHKTIAAALAVQGHHVGLQRANGDALRQLNPKTLAHYHPLQLTLSDPDLDRLMQWAETDGLIFRSPERTAVSLQSGMAQAVAAMLDVRMLFSCLVDADFLDTEAHFEGDTQGKRYRPKGPCLDAQAALTALEDYLNCQVRSGSRADARVRAAREALWIAAGEAGSVSSGLFTLTAPTGSGKTLAMLRFALKHAAHHGLKRIILAVPFLTIIEQTARVYRKVFADFPEHFVLEHHSLAGLGAERAASDNETDAERQRRLLAENWDAPIVLTTNVQLLESLFSNRPSACRKLHSLMESVILFDEAQSLPQHLAVPTLAALSHLSADYRT
jgi:CRISPR-associated endonuclease/helicase Cas3